MNYDMGQKGMWEADTKIWFGKAIVTKDGKAIVTTQVS